MVMKLLVVMITYGRLKYSKRTAMMLHGTIQCPYKFIVVDNASDDGTQAWIKQQSKIPMIDGYILNETNRYPGAATNQGWEYGLELMPDATHLMRLDNDMWLNLGWDTEAEKYFEAMPKLGQLGLDWDATKDHQDVWVEENGMKLNPWPGIVGGPCIIPRRIWDEGHRYSEAPWRNSTPGVPQMQEDSLFSHGIQNKGYQVGHMQKKLSFTFANEKNWHEYEDYYKKTFSERGYEALIPKIKKPEDK